MGDNLILGCYRLLGLSRSNPRPTLDEAEAAFKKARQKFHPDRAREKDKAEAHKIFCGLPSVYQTVCDDIRRGIAPDRPPPAPPPRPRNQNETEYTEEWEINYGDYGGGGGDDGGGDKFGGQIFAVSASALVVSLFWIFIAPLALLWAFVSALWIVATGNDKNQ